MAEYADIVLGKVKKEVSERETVSEIVSRHNVGEVSEGGPKAAHRPVDPKSVELIAKRLGVTKKQLQRDAVRVRLRSWHGAR
jgi:hypothetical protein